MGVFAANLACIMMVLVVLCKVAGYSKRKDKFSGIIK